PNAFAHSLGEFEMMPVARRQVTAALRDADDGPARLQLAAREAEVQIALEVERGHTRIMRVVEPGLRAQPALRIARCRWFAHGFGLHLASTGVRLSVSSGRARGRTVAACDDAVN